MEPCYIGRKPCGCIVFAIIDNPDHKHDVAKELGRCVRAGLAIERVTAEYVRTAAWGCNCGKACSDHHAARKTQQALGGF